MRKFERQDWLTAVLFFGVAVACYGATRTRLAYLWDSVEFVLAMTQYDVALSQPHAPGYFLYIQMAKLVDLLVRDPHASLVWLSVVCGAALSGAVYLLGTALFGRQAGWGAGLATLTSPMVWFYSSVALTYVVDAALVATLVLLCWRAMQDGVPWRSAFLVAGVFALIGGVRQQSVPGLLCLVAGTFWSGRENRWMKIIVATSVFGVLTALWFGWMLHLTGGWDVYWKSFQKICGFHAHKTLAGGGVAAVGWNMFFAGLYCFEGLFLGVVILLAAVRKGAERKWEKSQSDHRLGWQILAWWGLPVFLLATLVGYSEAPGHVFTYLPVLFLVVGAVIGAIESRRWRRTVVVGLCGVNLFTFFLWPMSWDGALWGTMRTNRELRQHDAALGRYIQVIRRQYTPRETVICHVHGDLLFGLRHFQLYLPDYDNIRIDPDFAMVTPAGRGFVMAKEGRTVFVATLNPHSKRRLLLVARDGDALDCFRNTFHSSVIEVYQQMDLSLFETFVE